MPPNANTLTFQRTVGAANGVLVLDAPLWVANVAVSWRGGAPVSLNRATVLTLESA